jgi:hypothetical protein
MREVTVAMSSLGAAQSTAAVRVWVQLDSDSKILEQFIHCICTFELIN